MTYSWRFVMGVADHVDSEGGAYMLSRLSGWKLLVIIILGVIGVGVCALVGFVVFTKRQEDARKRFYWTHLTNQRISWLCGFYFGNYHDFNFFSKDGDCFKILNRNLHVLLQEETNGIKSVIQSWIDPFRLILTIKI